MKKILKYYTNSHRKRTNLFYCFAIFLATALVLYCTPAVFAGIGPATLTDQSILSACTDTDYGGMSVVFNRYDTYLAYDSEMSPISGNHAAVNHREKNNGGRR